MTPNFHWMRGPAYEPPYVRPDARRRYLKHRSWLRPVFVTLMIVAVIFGALAAIAGFEAPQL